jgi:hypothetical protein
MARIRKALTATALGAAAFALIAAAAGTTGAYFSDSHDGSINASTGAVQVDVGNTTLNFSKLLPGQFQTKTVSYTAQGSEAEDIWLVFPTDGKADLLNGKAGGDSANSRPDLALGRYGHFAVKDASGATLFTSFNLASNRIGDTTSVPCYVDAQGHGGSSVEAATRESEPKPPYCPVPTAILIGSSVAPGVATSADITFGFTKLQRDPAQQSLPAFTAAPFKIVATQVGILPTDPNN